MNVLNIIKQARGEKQAIMLEAHGREVAQIESGNKFDAIQRQRSDNQLTGPGRGLYQYEVSGNNLGGETGSGASKTALTRYKNFYKKYGQEIPEQYQEELKRVNNDNPDFSKLSRELQQEIFYADKERGRLPLDELAAGTLSLKDAYVDYHWIGNQQSDQYDAERDRVSTLYEQKIPEPFSMGVQLPQGAALTGGRSGDNIHTNYGTGVVKEGSPEHKALIERQENKNMEKYMKAKQNASKKASMKFDILNVMEDLGQVFQRFDKEDK